MEAPEVAMKIIEGLEKRPLVFDVFSLAESYNKAAQLLEKNGLIGPAIINSAFSAELLLKSFILSDHIDVFYEKDLKNKGVNIYGHAYSELLSKISLVNQDKILRLLGKKMGTTFTFQELKDNLKNYDCKAPFVDWRYIFEEEGLRTINYYFLTNFCDVLGSLMSIILKPYKEN